MILSGRIHDGENVAVSAKDEGLTFNGQLARIDTEAPPVPKSKLN
jgi:ATP-dependent Clp protease ATP-binding subunit ClpB